MSFCCPQRHMALQTIRLASDHCHCKPDRGLHGHILGICTAAQISLSEAGRPANIMNHFKYFKVLSSLDTEQRVSLAGGGNIMRAASCNNQHLQSTFRTRVCIQKATLPLSFTVRHNIYNMGQMAHLLVTRPNPQVSVGIGIVPMPDPNPRKRIHSPQASVSPN